jgi:hypothetical protein
MWFKTFYTHQTFDSPQVKHDFYFHLCRLVPHWTQMLVVPRQQVMVQLILHGVCQESHNTVHLNQVMKNFYRVQPDFPCMWYIGHVVIAKTSLMLN